MMDLLIKNGLIVSDEVEKNFIGDIYINKAGTIEEVGKNLKHKASRVIDAEKKAVMPGFIDMCCNISESGYENKNNVYIVSKAAIAGGFTTITSSPNVQPIVDNKAVVEYIYSEAEARASINILPYGSLTKGCNGKELAEVGEMIVAGAVALSDGGSSISDAALFRDILMYTKMFDIPVVVFSLDMELADGGVVNNGYMSTKLGLIGVPQEAEEIMVSRNIIFAKHTGAKLHLSHITTEGSVDLIRSAKLEGVNITCSTCAHYFSLTEEAVDDYNTYGKVYPPLRTQKDVDAIKRGLKDNTIDVITTGHSPTSPALKHTEFGRAAYGLPGLETAFSLTVANMIDDEFTVYDLARKMSTVPAKILKLKNKGKIRVGYDADLTIGDLNEKVVVNSSKFESKAKYSPFDGHELKGKITNTIVKGSIPF